MSEHRRNGSDFQMQSDEKTGDATVAKREGRVSFDCPIYGYLQL